MASKHLVFVAYITCIFHAGEVFTSKVGAQSRSYQRQSHAAPRPQLFLPFYHRYYFKLPNFVDEPSYKITPNFDFTKCVFRTNLNTVHDLVAPFNNPMSSRMDYYTYYKLHRTSSPNAKERGDSEVSYTFEHHFNTKNSATFETTVPAEHIVHCNVTNFCMANTIQLCLRNGTVLCVARFEHVASCEQSDLLCVKTNLSTPCVGKISCFNDTTDDAIPCLFNASVHGALSSKSFRIYKAVENVTIITVANYVAERNHETTLEEIVRKRGVVEKYCVTLAAQPILAEQKLSYSKFLMFLQKNPDVIMSSNVRCVQYMKSLLDMLYS